MDAKRSILAGHSLGGELAIYMTLNGSVKARRFLAIGPAGPFMDDLNEWEPLLHENPIQGIQGVYHHRRAGQHHLAYQHQQPGRDLQPGRHPHPAGDHPGCGA